MERRKHGLVEHRVGHFAVEISLPREQTATLLGSCVRGRSTQANIPTSICANEDDVYCMRGVGAK